MAKWRKRQRELVFVYSSLAPILLLFLIFLGIPLFMAIWFGFFEIRLPKLALTFRGLKNYLDVFSDRLFYVSIKNTLYFVLLKMCIGIPLSFLIGFAISRALRLRNFYLTCYFAPMITAVAAISVLFFYFYNPYFGLFNQILSFLGLPTLHFLRSTTQALPSIAAMMIWQGLGFGIVLFLAGIQGIPEVYNEAARVDGATSWQVLLHITIPLLKPVIILMTILTFIGSWQVFDAVYMMAKEGEPINSTRVITLHIYKTAFERYQLGYASAIAFILFLILLISTLIQLKIGKLEWEY